MSNKQQESNKTDLAIDHLLPLRCYYCNKLFLNLSEKLMPLKDNETYPEPKKIVDDLNLNFCCKSIVLSRVALYDR